MDVLLKVISQQWIFILLAGLLIGFLYLVKAKRPKDFQKIALIELVVSIAALVLFALFGFPDLFLLAPIIIICCELFGYIITGKCVGVLLIDFLLIQFLWFLETKTIINSSFSQIIFYVLQLVAAVAIGILIDNHIRALNKEKKQKIAANKEQEELQKKKMDKHVDEIISKYGDGKKADDDTDKIEELEVSDILKKYSLDDDSDK
ncbi:MULTISPECIES: hypothetical protein [unclassified Ruminococcus]|uniref:hypothetical protein n=1 Tax=unclassified Ruminococcus TaxID=2608920 RepID=UPI0021094124|nr:MULTISPECIES: hypothetical protein [unclassified Ruminococcus]MCQ4022278.1 hypothetical protein [Ruminococcus sp. zg-924]MCQ4114606.1 hypothetical protein [Ruminococcus sp. zg-921]